MADSYHEMSLEENRLASFGNWPFQDEGQEGICTAKRGAFHFGHAEDVRREFQNFSACWHRIILDLGVEKMAETGFFSCATDAAPDLVRCYVCLKELEGWEPTDNPWLEHKSHSADCAFVKKGKPQAELTVEEFIKMEIASQQNKVVKKMESKIVDVVNLSEDVLEELLKLGSC